MNKVVALINGRLLDPKTQSTTVMNLFFNESGVLVGMGYVPEEEGDEMVVIDLKGATILPNIMDAHTHLREPGGEGIETLETASLAALHSGITLLIATPDTTPPVDTPEMVLFIHTRRKQTAHVPIYTMGMLTQQGAGLTLAERQLMVAEGAIGFTDGNSLTNTALMRLALQYEGTHPIVVTPYDPYLSDGGGIVEGAVATRLGLKGIPSESESVRMARDIALCEKVGGRLHFFPVTTRKGVELIRSAKAKGLPITCGTAPHYFWLDDTAIEGYPTCMKVSPPLQSADDVLALIEGIQDGTIDVIASGHSPTAIDDKRCDWTSATSGVSGIETLVPATLTRLVPTVGIHRILACLSTNPNQIFGLKKQGIALGNSPSLGVFRLDESVTVNASSFVSMGKCSPFDGMTLQGKAVLTMVDGHIKWQDSSL